MSIALIFSALLFSLSSNLDNIVVGIAYGIKKINIKFFPNLIIALVTTTGTFLSMTVGEFISRYLPHYFANIIGASAIILLGLYFTIQSLRKIISKKESKDLALRDVESMIEYADESDLDKSGDINLKEAFLIALGLTFNNLGTGIAASVTGVNIQVTVLCTFIFSILTILLGDLLGNHVLGKFLGKYAPLISGVLLILLGIFEIIN